MPIPPAWLRYWHTLRHLQARQWTARAKRYLKRPTLDPRPAPAVRVWSTSRWQPGISTAPSFLPPDRWRLLNEEHPLPSLAAMDPELSHLWRYHAHYFDDLRAHDAEQRRVAQHNWLARWLAQCPPGTAVAWDAYPMSLRIVNWLKWSWQEGSLGAEAWQSLAVQTRWLMQDLEYHLLGNHLLANAKALVFAGCAFGGTEGDRWLRRGLEIYREQLPEQLLADGGHFELSPMYHAIILEDLFDVWNLATAAAPSLPELSKEIRSWEPMIEGMRNWLAAMTHPDGSLAHFNDSTQGQSASTLELERYAVRLGFAPLPPLGDGVVSLAASGYTRCQLDNSVLIIDAGRIGPDYLPGHAHADTLSCELSIGHIRALVNSGISGYGTGAERLFQRGTAAHNTVVVNGADSSEVWSGFRVARRAAPVEFEIERQSPRLIRVRAAHDGYRRFSKGILHRRWWTLEPRRLRIADEITGTANSIESWFRVGPTYKIETPLAEQFSWQSGGISLRCRLDQAVGILQYSQWHPGFGRSEPVSALRCVPVDSRWEQLWSW